MQHIYYHIAEIKLRFIYCVFSFILTILVSYLFQYELLYLITRPFLELQQKFIFVELTEALYTIIRVCFFTSLILIIPFIMYQFWSFFIPSCYFSERTSINNFLFFFFILLILEILCVYFLIFPKICEFLSSFQLTNSAQCPTFFQYNIEQDIVNQESRVLEPQLSKNPVSSSIDNSSFPTPSGHIASLLIIELSARIESYVKLIMRLLLLILLFFQIPFVFIIMYYNKFCTGYDLCINRKIFFFVCVLFAALISPPDIISQFFLIFFFFLLFEFLIFLGLVFDSRL